MPIMSKQLEDDFKICIDRVIESRYEDDKINCCIMDLKSKVLREMATSSNSDYAKCKDCGAPMNEGEAKTFTVCDDCWEKHFA